METVKTCSGSIHTHFESLYDTANDLSEMLDEFHKLGCTKVAVTDHGTASAYEDLLYIIANKKKKDPDYKMDIVFGIEGYFDDGNSHLILLARDEIGYKSLCNIIAESEHNFIKNKPIITRENLEKNIAKGHVFCTSACITGPFGRLFGLDEWKFTNKIAELEAENNRKNQTKIDLLKEHLAEIKSRDVDKLAHETFEWFTNVFGKNYFFFELQNHFLDIERDIYTKLIDFAFKEGYPAFIASNDIHMGVTSDSPKFDEMLLRRNVAQYRRFNSYQESSEDMPEYCIKTDAELKEALMRLDTGKTYEVNGKTFTFENVIDASIGNIGKLLDCCNIIPDKTKYYPKFCENDIEIFRQKVAEGIKSRFPEGLNEEYKKRLDMEMNIIESMGYASYHLIVADYLTYGRLLGYIPKEEIADAPLTIEELDKYITDKGYAHIGYSIGPGRGSAAGSLVCYLMGITDIDPLKYNLLFERFLNPERVSMPDIDSDFKTDIRQKCAEYVSNRYGADHVCKIMTKAYGQIKGNIRLSARYLGTKKAYEEGITSDNAIKEYLKPWYNMADRLAKLETKDHHVELEDCLDDTEKEILTTAQALSGMFTQYGQHAAGVVISGAPIQNIIPLMHQTQLEEDLSEDADFDSTDSVEPFASDWLQTQCQMAQAEEKGLLKMDFLGLRNLNIVTEIIREAGITTLQDYKKRDEALLDSKIYSEIYTKGNTVGVFQFESDGMKNMLKEFEPECFEDLILLVSAYRPGPMQYIPEIVAEKRYRKGEADTPPVHTITIDNKDMQNILSPTYGCPIYQEQIMQIFQTQAGYSLGGADTVRRFMSKKQADKLEAERHNFIYGNADIITSETARYNALLAEKGEEDKDVLEAKKRIPKYEILGCIKKQGMTEKEANDLFDQLMPFAEYGFNKSHATVYALVSFFTAWLKYYYPTLFYSTALNNLPNSNNRADLISKYLNEMSINKVKYYPPTIKNGIVPCHADENTVYLGSSLIKGITKEDTELPDTIEELVRAGKSDTYIKKFIMLGFVTKMWTNNNAEDYTNNRSKLMHDFNAIYPYMTKLFGKDGYEYKFATAEENFNKILTNNPDVNSTEYKKALRSYNTYSQKKTAAEENLYSVQEMLDSSDYPENYQDIIDIRAMEYDKMGIAFYRTEDSLNILRQAPAFNVEALKSTSSTLYKVPATVISVSKLKEDKYHKTYYDVSLMLTNNSIVTKRYSNPPACLNGMFYMYADKYWYKIVNAKEIPLKSEEFKKEPDFLEDLKEFSNEI